MGRQLETIIESLGTVTLGTLNASIDLTPVTADTGAIETDTASMEANLASLTTSLDAPLRHLTGTQTLLFNATDIMMTPEIDGHPLMLWSVKAERYGCADSNCIIAYNIQQPNHWKTPSYVIGGEAASYNIAANHPEEYSRLVFRQSGHEPTFPVDEFYDAVSAGMPPWIVMYFPPNTVIQDGEPLPYPVLYEQGQQLMFREPDHE